MCSTSHFDRVHSLPPSTLIFIYLNSLLFTTIASTPIDIPHLSTFAYIGQNSTSNDEPAEIALSPDAHLIYIGGNTSPLLRHQESDLQAPLSNGLRSDDFFIAKISSHTHHVQWVYRDGSSKEDRLQAMLLDKPGLHLLVAGRTFGQLGAIPNKGQADAFVIKYDVSGVRPFPVWENPLILATSASETVTALVQDPFNDDLVYATGFSSGNLFPGHRVGDQGRTDAIIFSFSMSTGDLIHSHQFGTAFSDQGTSIVVSEDADGPIFVSVLTEREIGQYTIGNFHLYKFARNALPLGDVLLKSFSRERISAFLKHPMLPSTLLVIGSSWLDERNGYDMFVKRVIRDFDNTDISSSETDIDQVSDSEYTKRVQSVDGSHDYSSGALVHPDSGVLLVSGYTGGKFNIQASDRGVLAPFISAIDPLDASVIGTVQTDLANDSSWIETAGIAMGRNRSFLYYMAKESNEETNQFHVAVGSFGLPELWKTPIKLPLDRKPSPSPNTDSSQDGSTANQISLPLILAAAGGAIAFVLIVVAIVIGVKVRNRALLAKSYEPRHRGDFANDRLETRVSFIHNGPRIEGRNTTGLV